MRNEKIHCLGPAPGFEAKGRPNRRGQGGEQGSSALAFALVLPILLALTMGLIEMGYMFSAQATVDKAAQVGARFAVTGEGVVEGDRLGLILSRTHDVADTLSGGDGVNVSVRSWDDIGAQGDPRENDPGQPCDLVEVEVLYAYSPVTPVIGSFLPDTIVLRGRERMVNEPWMPCG